MTTLKITHIDNAYSRCVKCNKWVEICLDISRENAIEDYAVFVEDDDKYYQLSDYIKS